MGTYLISYLQLTVVLVRWFLCTRLTFWKLEKLSKLKDLTDLTDTDDPDETEDTPINIKQGINGMDFFISNVFFKVFCSRVHTVLCISLETCIQFFSMKNIDV